MPETASPFMIRRPERARLINLSTMEEMDVLLNPTELSESISVNYARLGIVGMSHQQLQFSGTGNAVYPVDFYLDKFYAHRVSDDPDILDFRRFLLALTAPSANSIGISGGAPPRVLFIWPGKFISIECVLREVDFQFKVFAATGDPLIYMAKASLEEYRESRVTSEQLRLLGTMRP